MLGQIRNEVKEIIRSRDGEAWYKLGLSFGSGNFAKDPSLGWAIALASCDMGYDCRVTNPRNDWYGCTREGKCSETMNLNDTLQLTNAALYAKAYGKYQELKQLMKQGSSDEIEAYVPLDGALFQ